MTVAIDASGRAERNFRFGMRAIMFLGGVVLGAQVAIAVLRGDVEYAVPAHAETTADAARVPTQPALMITVRDSPPNGPVAVWVLRASHGMLEFVGFPTSGSSTYDDAALAALVAARIPTPIGGTLSLDRESVLALYDVVGPVRLNGLRLDGAQVLAYVDQADSNDERMIRQAAALQALLAQASLAREQPGFDDLFEVLSVGGQAADLLRNLLGPHVPLQLDAVRITVT